MQQQYDRNDLQFTIDILIKMVIGYISELLVMQQKNKIKYIPSLFKDRRPITSYVGSPTSPPTQPEPKKSSINQLNRCSSQIDIAQRKPFYRHQTISLLTADKSATNESITAINKTSQDLFSHSLSAHQVRIKSSIQQMNSSIGKIELKESHLNMVNKGNSSYEFSDRKERNNVVLLQDSSRNKLVNPILQKIKSFSSFPALKTSDLLNIEEKEVVDMTKKQYIDTTSRQIRTAAKLQLKESLGELNIYKTMNQNLNKQAINLKLQLTKFNLQKIQKQVKIKDLSNQNSELTKELSKTLKHVNYLEKRIQVIIKQTQYNTIENIQNYQKVIDKLTEEISANKKALQEQKKRSQLKIKNLEKEIFQLKLQIIDNCNHHEQAMQIVNKQKNNLALEVEAIKREIQLLIGLKRQQVNKYKDQQWKILAKGLTIEQIYNNKNHLMKYNSALIEEENKDVSKWENIRLIEENKQLKQTIEHFQQEKKEFQKIINILKDQKTIPTETVQQLQHLTKQNQFLKDQIQKTILKVYILQKQIQTAKNNATTLKKQNDNARQINNGLREELKILKEQTLTIKSHENEKQTKQIELQNVKLSYSSLKKQMQISNQIKECLYAKIQELQQQNKLLIQYKQTNNIIKHSQQHELTKWKEQHIAITQQLKSLQQVKLSLDATLIRYKIDNEQLQKQLENIKLINVQLSDSVGYLTSTKMVLTAEKQMLQKGKIQLDNKIEELNSNCNQIKKNIITANEANAKLQIKMQDLKKLNQKYRKQLTQANILKIEVNYQKQANQNHQKQIKILTIMIQNLQQDARNKQHQLIKNKQQIIQLRERQWDSGSVSQDYSGELTQRLQVQIRDRTVLQFQYRTMSQALCQMLQINQKLYLTIQQMQTEQNILNQMINRKINQFAIEVQRNENYQKQLQNMNEQLLDEIRRLTLCQSDGILQFAEISTEAVQINDEVNIVNGYVNVVINQQTDKQRQLQQQW